jgi:outer membrane protein TolC
VLVVSGVVLAKPPDSNPVRLNLNDAIGRALLNNESLLIAGNDVSNAGQRVREAWADVLPDVRLSGLYTRNFKQPVFFFPDFQTGEQTAIRIGSPHAYQVALTFDQPLYQAGKVSGAIKVANLYETYSNEGFEVTRADVIVAVRKAYYRVLLNEQLLNINRQSLEQRYQNLVNTRKLFLQGQVAELDTLTAWVDYTNLQPQVIQVDNALEISENQLKILLGMDLATPVELTNELTFEAGNGISFPGIYDEALRNRPEIRQLETQTEMLRRNIGITRAERLPKLYLNATYLGVSQTDVFFDQPVLQSSFSSALRLEIPVFDGFRTSAKTQQARLDYHNAQYRLQHLKKNVSIEVKTIYLRLQEAEKRVQVQENAITQAERALFMQQRRYSEGDGTQLELSGATLALNISKSNYVQAVHDHQVALAELDKALGRKY